jgi:hypothetical protein
MPDNWVTISEAVGLTGKSERTIRRYIADGSLSNRRERGRLLVNLTDILASESATPESPGITGKAEQDCQAEVRRLSDLLEEVRGERDYLRQLHAMSQAKLIEATASETKPRPRWRWPWSKDTG